MTAGISRREAVLSKHLAPSAGLSAIAETLLAMAAPSGFNVQHFVPIVNDGTQSKLAQLAAKS
jgi:hypothetical protein